MKSWIALYLIPCTLFAIQAAAGPTSAEPPAEAPLNEEWREESIYIPYEKLWKVFEKEGRGVFLSYEQFQELWKAKRDRTPPQAISERPIDAVVAEVDGVATVGKDIVEFTAEVTIEVLKPGWNEIPLQLHDVAVSEATLDEKPARVVFDPVEGYRLLLEHSGNKPEFKKLKLKFGKSYQKNPGRNEVGFRGPLAPVNRWEVRIPEAGVKVDIYPLLAATDVPSDEGADETRVLAFVGAAPNVRIAWTPRTEGARGLTALATVKSEQLVTVEEGVLRTRATLTYEISRTELSDLALEVPATQKVVNIFDPNVREWSVEDVDGVQRVAVQLFEPTQGTQALIVELERFGEVNVVRAPVIRALEVGRQQGVLGVRLGSGLRAEVTQKEGVLQLDATDLPPSLAPERPTFAYRFVKVPFDLTLRVEKIEPRILVDTHIEAHVRPEELVLDVFPVFDVQRAGVFELALTVPRGAEVRGVHAQAVAGATAARIDRHFVRETVGGEKTLVVTLSTKAKGRTSMSVRLRRVLNEPDLLSPTGKPVSVPVVIPRAFGDFIDQRSGRLVVYAPESLRLTPRKTSGLRRIGMTQAVEGIQAPPPAQEAERPMLSYAYGNDEVELTVAAERRAPHVTARQLLVVHTDSGVAKYRAQFFFDIAYSSVKALRVDVPSAQADRIRIATPSVRREVAPDAQAANGYEAWRIVGEKEFAGTEQFLLEWEEKIERLDVGKSVDLVIPRLVPQDVDRAWGQIILTKAESIDVAPAERSDGLRPIDPRYDLMPGPPVPEAAQAFEFHGDWALSVRATRFEAKEIKATSIERGLVRMVQTRSRVCSVQAVYRVASARQRLVIRLPEHVEFDTHPLRINGRRVSLEEGEKGEFYIPLVGLEQGKPFALELRYLVNDQNWVLRGPEFPMEPAMQQVFLTVYVPREWAYLGKVGPWDEEIIWRVRGFDLTPRSRRSDTYLMNWVVGDLDVDRETLMNFAADGRSLCYSTLRPPIGSKGALRIRVAPAWVVKAIVLSIIIGIGIRLLTRTLRERAVVIGACLIGLMIAGVFVPSLVRSLVSTAAFAAAVVVLIIWTLWYVLVQRPLVPIPDEVKDLAEQGREPPAPEPPPLETDRRETDSESKDGGRHA